ncbi:enolase [Alphaproteobacteria bacterium]|nr:enolase [Alphaproteobacteria bacterium]
MAREILDSRGVPTVEAKVVLESGAFGVAAVPSGASTGVHEACELRDGGSRYGGKGVLTAVNNVNTTIKDAVVGHCALDQRALDSLLCSLDGSANKSVLGANAILSVSMACCVAAADFCYLPVFRYLGGVPSGTASKPMLNVINGGVHADNALDIQEFMIVPLSAVSFSDMLEQSVAVFSSLKSILRSKGLSVNVGDEGGFAPALSSTLDALDLLSGAINNAGFVPGSDFGIALDVAASSMFDDSSYKIDGNSLNSDSLIDFYAKLIDSFPIVSIEDPFAEDDWAAWAAFTSSVGDKIQIVGDDLFVTNLTRLRRGISEQSANSILIKLNQIGTVSETLDTISVAKSSGFSFVVSHRSGETSDSFVADLAVATGAPFVKFGAPSRGERLAKYNRLLTIAA